MGGGCRMGWDLWIFGSLSPIISGNVCVSLVYARWFPSLLVSQPQNQKPYKKTFFLYVSPSCFLACLRLSSLSYFGSLSLFVSHLSHDFLAYSYSLITIMSDRTRSSSQLVFSILFSRSGFCFPLLLHTPNPTKSFLPHPLSLSFASLTAFLPSSPFD